MLESNLQDSARSTLLDFLSGVPLLTQVEQLSLDLQQMMLGMMTKRQMKDMLAKAIDKYKYNCS